ncbi:MAG TPA: DJ-1/PfpI family protein [Polyangiaceae bacterium]|jgi:protease I|nr:DJ-1/PfpI family protein [Polyangiaceae bacterium]
MMHLGSESGLGRALSKFRPLVGKRIAMLEANGLNAERLSTLREAFELAGAEVILVAPALELRPSGANGSIRADERVADTAPEVYHALCIPGAALAVVALRNSPEACAFARSFALQGKWVATLDHGALLLEDLGLVDGRAVTSDPALRTELEQSGASWASEAVIVDQQLVTAQGDAQLEAFVRIASLSFQEKRTDPPPDYH